MTRCEATSLVDFAVDAVIAAELDLLDLDVTERALSHQLAHYMAFQVQQPLSVDCEYNRDLCDPKRLPLPRRPPGEGELRATTVYPDIVVHQRNCRTRNLIVLEVKKPGESLNYDDCKLRGFKNVFNYEHAGHLILGRSEMGEIVRQLIWIE